MKLYDRRKVDELIFLDVGASRDGRGPDFDLISEVADYFSVPLTVGGGVRTYDDVKQLLRSGADKVAIGTAIDLLRDVAHDFSPSIVASVDYRGDECFVRSGTIPLNETPVRLAERVANLGVGEILLNSIDRDGTMQGYDLDMISAVSSAVSAPVIACGGCSGYEDMEMAIDAGASAVAAGALFQFTQATPIGACRYLKGRGFHVRV